VEPGTLVVDFANKHVGGGCFSGGFVQEEQMVAQSVDFAVRLHKDRQSLSETQAMSYEGIHIDAWWPRDDAAKKERLDVSAIQPCASNPLTILAVDAPKLGHKEARTYTRRQLEWLTRKILLIFSVAEDLQSPRILSGLLGGGAFRNNRPLILLLHLLLQPVDDRRPLLFHYPVFSTFCSDSSECLEQRILQYADAMLDKLRSSGVQTLRQALQRILELQLPLSNFDVDLADSANSSCVGYQRDQNAKSVAEPSSKSARWKKER
jgi:tRNA A37 N6-isopentenylltransferase MiaA